MVQGNYGKMMVFTRPELSRVIISTLLIILLIIYFYVPNEIVWLSYLVLCIIVAAGISKLVIKPVDIYLLILSPLVWSLLMSFKNDFYHTTQGFFNLSIPVLTMIFGALLYKAFNVKDLLRFLIIAGTVISLYFIIYTLIAAGIIAFISPYKEARFLIGNGSPASVLGLVAAAYSGHFGLGIFKRNSGRYLVIIINLIAVYLFASRTYWVILFIFLIIFSLKTMRQDRVLFYGSILVALALIVIMRVNTREGLTFKNSIMYKFVNSFREIQVADFKNEYDINIYYRGYESYRSWLTFTEASIPEKFFGSGAGKLVKLETEILLNGAYWKEVPWVHNGFFYILVKTGILGLISYLVLFIYMIFRSLHNIRQVTKEKLFVRLLLLGVTLSLFLATFVNNGLFNLEMALMLTLTGYLNSSLSYNDFPELGKTVTD